MAQAATRARPLPLPPCRLHDAAENQMQLKELLGFQSFSTFQSYPVYSRRSGQFRGTVIGKCLSKLHYKEGLCQSVLERKGLGD
jgi:hypothetical protein